jgi:hypothetical protein
VAPKNDGQFNILVMLQQLPNSCMASFDSDQSKRKQGDITFRAIVAQSS